MKLLINLIFQFGSESRNKSGKMIKFCNIHVRELAKPNKRLLMQTFLKHYPYLNIIHVEKIVAMLDDKITPKEAQKIIKKDRRKKIGSKHRKNLDDIKVIVEDLLNIFKSFVCNNETFNLDPFEEQLSAAVYCQLLNILGTYIMFSNVFQKLIFINKKIGAEKSYMIEKRLIESIVLKAAKNISIWMNLLIASELSIAQKYEEDTKQNCLKSCCSHDRTVCIEYFLNLQNRVEDTSAPRIIAEVCSSDENKFDELFEKNTDEIGTSNAPVAFIVPSSSNFFTASNVSKISDLFKITKVPSYTSASRIIAEICSSDENKFDELGTDEIGTLNEFAVSNAPVAIIVPSTLNFFTASIDPKLLDAFKTSNANIASNAPKLLDSPNVSNANIVLEDQQKITDLVPISLHNMSSILLQDSKTPKSLPHLIVLRECSSDYDRNSTLSFQVVGGGLNKVFLLSKVSTSCDLQAFCQQFCESKDFVLYEISDKNLNTNEFDAKRLTGKEIKQYCKKFELFYDEEITCENEEVHLDSSSDVFNVREVGKNEFQRIEVKQNNGNHNFKVKILQPNHEQK